MFSLRHNLFHRFFSDKAKFLLLVFGTDKPCNRIEDLTIKVLSKIPFFREFNMELTALMNHGLRVYFIQIAPFRFYSFSILVSIK
jgi:hypothetical protein